MGRRSRRSSLVFFPVLSLITFLCPRVRDGTHVSDGVVGLDEVDREGQKDAAYLKDHDDGGIDLLPIGKI